MDSLRFTGTVATGATRFHREIEVPGAADLPGSVKDFPVYLYPGSLNIQVNEAGYPDEFERKFGERNIRKLDTRIFRAEIELPFDCIRNNTLTPTSAQSDRGNAQIWRATLVNLENSKKEICWVLRRIGSGYMHVLECIAGSRLRNTLDLYDGCSVEIIVEGCWQES